MDEEKLKTALRPWLSSDTWHTGHPKDEQRFHRSLNAAFGALRPNVEAEQFAGAIRAVLSEKYPSHLKIHAREIQEFAQRGEDIGSYLFDLQ